MGKDDLLKQIAERAYNVEFGAFRNFATYDAVTKIPDIISIVSIIIGILGFVWADFTKQEISTVVLVLSFLGLYISRFSDSVDKYESAGRQLTNCYYDMKNLYAKVKNANDNELDSFCVEFNKISEEVSRHYISRQFYFSDIRANYKFFQRDDLEWMDEQLHFSFFKDKVPYSAKAIFWMLVGFVILVSVCLLYGHFIGVISNLITNL